VNQQGDSALRRLDERVLPAAAERLQRGVAAARRWGRARANASGVAGAVVRRKPALAASIVAVTLGAVLVAVAGDHGGGSTSGKEPLPVAVASLGPVPGASVADYLRNAAFDLRHFGEIAKGRSTYAIVDLRAYRTPGQAATAFAGVDVVRAYVRVPHKKLPTQVHSVALRGIGDLSNDLRTTAAVAAATAKSYAVLVSELHPRSRADRQVKARYAAQQRAAAYEARVLAHADRCSCVFAVVVRADVARLAALIRVSAVRVVDPAPPTVALEALSIFPLEPEITTTVPKTGLVGG
jgi:hypothetical protein